MNKWEFNVTGIKEIQPYLLKYNQHNADVMVNQTPNRCP